MPDSSVAGFLTPTSAAPQNDLSLDDILQLIVVGLSGLPGANVRSPSWPITPKEPADVATNWAAVGVTSISSLPFPIIEHDGTSQGSDQLTTHETIAALLSFYGPRGQEYASIARDGIYLQQNHGMLAQYEMALVGVGPIRCIPELINQQYRRRYDFTLTLRRKVTRVYEIRNFASAEVQLTTDDTPPFTADIAVSE